jgi:hypothetical protein
MAVSITHALDYEMYSTTTALQQMGTVSCTSVPMWPALLRTHSTQYNMKCRTIPATTLTHHYVTFMCLAQSRKSGFGLDNDMKAVTV